MKCERCNELDIGDVVRFDRRILNSNGMESFYLCAVCLFQLQMSIQIWIDESDKDSELYRLYGERSELDEN